MHYLSVENLSKTYADKPLFTNISFHIQEGDKIALVALNGTGKSTLLKILCGLEPPDEGTITRNKEVKIVFLDQDPAIEEERNILENIFNRDHPVMNVLKKWEQITTSPNPDTAELSQATAEMDRLDAWHFESRIREILGKLNIHHLDQKAATLSGGQKKRIALAQILVDIDFDHRHTLLILDEPTNHLDTDMIEWLEFFLSKEKITLLLVTHDRYFLDRICNQIIELDQQQLFCTKGGYEAYLTQKALRTENEHASITKAKNRYRKELEWMRRQPRARTTKSKARQDAFHEWKARATQKSTEARLQLEMKMSRLGGKILELKKVYKSFDATVILNGFDYTFKRGERIGIVGANGVGKSTFIHLLLGKEKPDSGKINTGETVIFGDFSQEGLIIKEELRVIEYVKEIAEFFPLSDGTKISASQFLQRFLFTPEKQYNFISKLSGGEKKRLQLLSVLFRNPNFLILDEPTNDLDLPTLTLLEAFLLDFPGCLIVVSHDRYFMDRIIDHLFVFEGNGQIRDFPGNYSQYRQAIKEEERHGPAATNTSNIPSAANSVEKTGGSETKPRKLTFNEQREMQLLEKEIAALELEHKQLEATMNSGTLPYNDLEKAGTRMSEITTTLNRKELRWLELSEIADAAEKSTKSEKQKTL